MSRTSSRYRNFSFSIICCFLLAFIFIQCYWQTFIRIQCVLSHPIQLPRRKYSFYDHFPYRTIHTCRNEQSNLSLTIAVLSSFDRLSIYLPSIVNTWALV